MLWYCKNKDVFSFNPPYEETNLMEFIEQHKKDKIGFYYTRIIKNYGKKTLLGNITTGSGENLQIFEHSNFEFSSIGQVCKEEKISEEDAYNKYYNDIFMVTNAQTSLLTKVNDFVNQKEKLISYVYIPSTGKSKGKLETKFVWNETLVVWLKDSSYKKGNKIIKTEQIGTSWSNISWGRLDIEGDMPYKNGKKPTALIRQLINMVVEPNDYILDFFSGSASTAHACMIESCRDKKLRSISIQLPEDLDSSFEKASKEKKKELKKLIEILDCSKRNHCLDEIGQERIVRARKQLLSEFKNTTADLGFKHYTLKAVTGDTLDKLEEFNPNEQGLLLNNDLLHEFGSSTILTTWLVRDGYGFNGKVVELDFAGYKAYWCDKHLYLINPELSKDAIAKIVEKFELYGNFNPENVVLFGYSFLWNEIDELKINLNRLKETEKNLRINYDVRY